MLFHAYSSVAPWSVAIVTLTECHWITLRLSIVIFVYEPSYFLSCEVSVHDFAYILNDLGKELFFLLG